MRVLITANHVPFMPGGADTLMHSLIQALHQAGHQAELLRLPFQFAPETAITHQMDYCQQLDLSAPNGQHIDLLLSLQFPGYGIHHPHHRIWLMHQHRAAYELYQPQQASPQAQTLRQQIHTYDRRHLAQAEAVYTISHRVAQRVTQNTGISARAIYHPPAGEHHYYTAEALDYIFYPSRLETLKRQDLLIKAAAHLKSPVKILLAGTGGQTTHYQNLINQLDVGEKVQLLGHITEAQKLTLYARSLAVAFPPQDEDLGYITLEAQLASKAVITCTDSGGPLEFIQHRHNGIICPPDPEELAAAIDQLHQNPSWAKRLGQNGKETYTALNLSWHNTLHQLLETP